MARILIIDDNVFMRSVLIDKLEAGGHDVIWASDGDVGIKLYKERHPDLIVTDIFMPEKNGLEVISEAKLLYPEAKIIAISGGSIIKNSNCLQVAKDLGVAHCFEKPIDWEAFLAAVKKLCSD